MATKPKKKMNKTHRTRIMDEVNRLIKLEVPVFLSLWGGEQEVVQDEYIERVAKEQGWTLSEFYATDGKILNQLLGLTNFLLEKE